MGKDDTDDGRESAFGDRKSTGSESKVSLRMQEVRKVHVLVVRLKNG